MTEEMTREESLESHLSDAADLLDTVVRNLHMSPMSVSALPFIERLRGFLGRPEVRHVREMVRLRDGAQIDDGDLRVWMKHAEGVVGFTRDLQARVLARRVLALTKELETERQRESD